HVPDCTGHYRDHYRRMIATCTVGGRDMAEAMVRAGWALDVARYSGGRYAAAEAEARAAKRGIWEGSFAAPASWRREHPLSERGTRPRARRRSAAAGVRLRVRS